METYLPEHFFRAPAFEAETPPGVDKETGNWKVIGSRPPADWLAAQLPRWGYSTEIVGDSVTHYVVVQRKPFRLAVRVSWECDDDDVSFFWASATAGIPSWRRILHRGEHEGPLRKLDEDLLACLRNEPGVTLLPGEPE